MRMNLKTKLDYWCESIIEAGWLAALVVAPMFFNVFSSRVFEPDKISLVRSIALVMLLAWLVKLVNSGQMWRPPARGLISDDAPSDEADGDDTETESAGAGGLSLQALWRIPFFLPMAMLLITYLLSTVFSVAPFVSWWGSYQRLQGTYSYLSYLIIALLTMGHLRSPDQIRRLQHVIILTSLPIAIYGIIQHYRIDPLPWGGDVSIRIAANAGNAIFLAAYLLMAVFFTFERIYSSFAYLLGNGGDDESQSDLPTALVGGAYLFIFMVQLLAIFWTQSRGPFLGLLLGTYLFGLLLFSALRPRGYRVWTLGWIGAGLVAALFLVLLNTTALGNLVGSVNSLRRLSTMLDLESTNAQVRVLIWEGAADMVAPHEPIIYPDGSTDRVNAIRPLIGYGPEAMWVSYNPFYPPELAHYERRNASPDRSHNETWDSLVITGILGFIAYMAVFISVFYWALRWLSLIINRRDTILFGSLLAFFGTAFTIWFYLWDGSWRFLGVAIPAGMMLGLGIYVTIAVFLHPDIRPKAVDVPRQLLIITLIATFAAHFVEIHFGIAIAATRTYFWVETALLLTLGMYWSQPVALQAKTTDVTADAPEVGGSGRSRRKRRRSSAPRSGGSGLSALPATVMSDVLIFLTAVFIYTMNSRGTEGVFNILYNSIFMRPSGSNLRPSPAIFFLLLFTWLVAATVGLATAAIRQRRTPEVGWWLRGYGLHAAVVWGSWLMYGLIQSARLAPGAAGTTLDEQLAHVANHFAVYTWLLVIWVLVAGVAYAWPWLRSQRVQYGSRLLVSGVSAVVLAVITFLIIGNVNIGLVRADIIYKQGQQFDSQRNWVSSIDLYRRALRARTTEDHYMLFLGRALLEQAKQAEPEGTVALGAEVTFEDVLALSPEEVQQMGRFDLLAAAEAILLRAQTVNPLNTDHTANLARLYRSWSDLSTDEAMEQEMLDESIGQYNLAVQLSPNAAHLWNEKANTHLARGEPAEAEAAYQHSLSLDQLYEQTYLLLADFYNRRERYADTIEVLQPGIQAMDESSRARPTPQMYSYLGVAYDREGMTEQAIDANLAILELQPENFSAMRNLAVLYRNDEQLDKAVEWTENALAVTADDNTQQILQLRQFLVELYRSMEQPEQVALQYELMRQMEPNNVTFLRNLYTLYSEEENADKTAEILQALIAVEPGNYQHPLDLAQILLEEGQVSSARQYAEQALALAPEDQKASINELIQSMDAGS